MDLSPLTVLVADDDAGTREALAAILEGRGAAAAVAVDGQDALERLEQGEAPCLVLLDWVMPRLGGEAFLRARQASAELSDIPVIVMSATHVPTDGVQVQGYLAKPFQVGDLLPLLGKVCETDCPRSRRIRMGCDGAGRR